MKKEVVELPNLTPLRGFAAIMVVVYHFDGAIARLAVDRGNMFVSKAYLMVDLFFILSGFIMLHVYGESFRSEISFRTFRRFIQARFARVYPLHLFLLLVLIYLVYVARNPYMTGDLSDSINDPRAIPTHVFMLHSFGFHDIFTWNGPSWSISAEWWAYMLFPFLVFYIAKNPEVWMFWMSVVVLSLYLLIEYGLPRSGLAIDPSSGNDINVSHQYGYIRGISGFMTGMILYHLYTVKRISRLVASDITLIIITVCVVISLRKGINDLFIMPLFALLVLCTARNDGYIRRVLRWRPLQFLGDISYSIYMVHYILILLFGIHLVEAFGYKYWGPGSLQLPFNKGLFICMLFVLAVILVSSATYFLIEKPARKLIRNYGVKAQNMAQQKTITQ